MQTAIQESQIPDAPIEGLQDARNVRGAFLILSCLVIAAIGLLIQFSIYLNHDIAWVLYSARLMMSGAIFGQDIIAANPPLIWYLSYPVVAFSNLFDIRLATAFRLIISFLVFASSLWGRSIIQRSTFSSLANAFLLSSVFVFFLDTYRDFGQRDSLALMFCLPYLCMSAAKADGKDFSSWEAIAAGIFAGMGLSLKPYFLLVPVLVELVLLKPWDWKRHCRAEVYAAIGFIVAYIGYLMIFAQEYLYEAIPLIKQIYWGFESSPWTLMNYSAEELTITCLCLVLLFSQKSKATFVKVMFAVAIGFLVSYFAQNKGYSYHQAPYRASLFIAVCVWISSLRFNLIQRNLKLMLQTILLCLILLSTSRTANWYLAFNNIGIGSSNENTRRGAPSMQSDLIATVNRYADSNKFLAFSTHPFPGFPTAVYADTEWTSRTNSRIFLPAVARLRSMNLPKNDERLIFAETMERQYALRDLSQNADVIFIDDARHKHGLSGTQFDILAFYQEEELFRDMWEAYEEIEQIGSTRVFIRSHSL